MSSKLLGERKKGKIFILSGPAGSGKTTLVHLLTQEFKEVVLNISFTTRDPRPTELEGKDYFFITHEAFAEKVAAGDFLEYVELFGTFYGSSKGWVESQLSQGRHVFLVINTEGALELKKIFDAPLIFVTPPSLAVLEQRLRMRKTENEEQIKERLLIAKREIKQSKWYNYLIVNDDLESAYQVVRSIVIAELHKAQDEENT